MMELAIWVCYLRAIRCCWLFLFMSFFLLFMVFQSISHILASVKKLWTLSKWNGMKSTNEKRNDDIKKWIKKNLKTLQETKPCIHCIMFLLLTCCFEHYCQKIICFRIYYIINFIPFFVFDVLFEQLLQLTSN